MGRGKFQSVWGAKHECGAFGVKLDAKKKLRWRKSGIN
jgi:hypothetical protein